MQNYVRLDKIKNNLWLINNARNSKRYVGRIVTRPAENSANKTNDKKTITSRTQTDGVYWWKVIHSMTMAITMRDETRVGLHELPVTICVAWCQCWNSRAASSSWHMSWRTAGSRLHSRCLQPSCGQLLIEEQGFADLQSVHKSNLI